MTLPTFTISFFSAFPFLLKLTRLSWHSLNVLPSMDWCVCLRKKTMSLTLFVFPPAPSLAWCPPVFPLRYDRRPIRFASAWFHLDPWILSLCRFLFIAKGEKVPLEIREWGLWNEFTEGPPFESSIMFLEFQVKTLLNITMRLWGHQRKVEKRKENEKSKSKTATYLHGGVWKNSEANVVYLQRIDLYWLV